MACVPSAPSSLLNTRAMAPSPQLRAPERPGLSAACTCFRAGRRWAPAAGHRPAAPQKQAAKQHQINASWGHRSDLGDPSALQVAQLLHGEKGHVATIPPSQSRPHRLRCCPSTGHAGAAGPPGPADLPLHRARASSWCSRGWPSLPDPPLDHLRALDTKATRSGEFGSIRLNSLARFSENTNRPHSGAHHGLGSPCGASRCPPGAHAAQREGSGAEGRRQQWPPAVSAVRRRSRCWGQNSSGLRV